MEIDCVQYALLAGIFPEGPAVFVYMGNGISDSGSPKVYDSRPPWLVPGLV